MSKLLYVTGLNGSIHSGLGKYMKDNGFFDDFIELNESFNSLNFKDKLKVIEDKLSCFNNVEFSIIAVSFGAYLVLNEVLKDSYVNLKDVFLLSPVLGPVMLPNGGKIPPNFSSFKKLLLENKSNANFKIVYGTKDPICPKENLQLFIENITNKELVPLQNQTHSLNIKDVQSLIKSFLTRL